MLLHVEPLAVWGLVPGSFPKQIYLWGVRRSCHHGLWGKAQPALENRGQLLCAGAVLRACRLRHSAAKVLGRVTFTEKHNGFHHIFLQKLFQDQIVSESLLRAS